MSSSSARRASAASCARSIVSGSGSTISSIFACSRNSSRCRRRRACLRASSRTRFVATAKSHARSLTIVSCRSARRKVSCATSSAQSRSPSRRVRYLTSGWWYSRKRRSRSVTRFLVAPSHHALTSAASAAARQLRHAAVTQLDRARPADDHHARAERERARAARAVARRVEVCLAERFDHVTVMRDCRGRESERPSRRCRAARMYDHRRAVSRCRRVPHRRATLPPTSANRARHSVGRRPLRRRGLRLLEPRCRARARPPGGANPPVHAALSSARGQARLVDEIRRELGRDAIALAERCGSRRPPRRRPPCLRFSALRIADALRRPEARDERIVTLAIGEVDRRLPAHRCVATTCRRRRCAPTHGRSSARAARDRGRRRCPPAAAAACSRA